MRQERTPMDRDGESVGYTFFFQIANDGGRRACRVRIDAVNIHEASALFRQKWSVIESMARDRINGGDDGDGVITVRHALIGDSRQPNDTSSYPLLRRNRP
jgi:hypothetical protein